MTNLYYISQSILIKKKYFGSSEKNTPNQQRHDNSVMNIYIQTITYETIFYICDKDIADIFPIASCNYKIRILKQKKVTDV